MDSAHQIEKKDHERISQILAKAFEDSIKKVIPNHKLKSMAGFVKLLNNSPVLQWSTGKEGVTVRHISLTPPKSEPIRRRKSELVSEEGEGLDGMMSTRVHGSDRERLAEERAIAPNFVHSLDAEHMRFVARGIFDHQKEIGVPPQFWMVHDAFGCHPNDMSELRRPR